MSLHDSKAIEKTVLSTAKSIVMRLENVFLASALMNGHFHIHDTITTCLTQLTMNLDGYHSMQVDKTDYTHCSCKVNVAILIIKTTSNSSYCHEHSVCHILLSST